MAWWTQAGLTTTIAHDALNGGGDLLINRMAAVNPMNIGSNPITRDDGKFWNVIGNGSTPMEYTTQVTRPTSGACVALIKPSGATVLQVAADDSMYMLYLNGSAEWTDYNGAFPVASPGFDVWQCVGLWWNSTTYRYYINNAWADVAHPSAGVMPANLKGSHLGNPYNVNGRLAGMGVWSGTVTLALLQNIESMMRSELASTGTFQGVPRGDVRATVSAGEQGSGDVYARVSNDKRLYLNIYNGGATSISGVVTIENVPAARRVRLYDRHSGLLVAETFSASNGAYTFNNLNSDREYFAVAHDHLRVYNAVIQDMLKEA